MAIKSDWHIHTHCSCDSELKHAFIENKVAFELNNFIFHDDLPKSFIDEYLGFVADLQRGGVTVSFGSDCHSKDLSGSDYERVSEIFKH